jgi:hypothetical protein
VLVHLNRGGVTALVAVPIGKAEKAG